VVENLPTWKDIEKLKDEIATLKEEVAQLKAILALPIIVSQPIKLSRAGAVVLGALYRTQGVVTLDTLETLCQSVVKVEMSRAYIYTIIDMLRRKLRPHDITIETVWDTGWSMSDASRANLISMGYTIGPRRDKS
jgi:hypothetical protein